MTSELPSDMALVAVVIALAFTLLLFLYSLGLRIAHILHDRDSRKLQKHWWPIFARAALDEAITDTRDLRVLRYGSRNKLLREWCRIRTHVRGDSGKSLEHLAKELGLLKVARRLLRSRLTARNLLAIQALGFLRDARSWAALVDLLQHGNVSIAVTAAMALVQIEPGRATHLIIPMLVRRKRWPRTQVGRILNVAGPDVVTSLLCKEIEAANDDDARYLLQYYESAYLLDIDSLVARLLMARSDAAVIAAALKAVRGHLPNTMIERLAKHRVWFVRMQAASLLGRFGRREDYPILEPLLSDQEWWVRYRAAQAITKLPFLGPNALRKLCDRQTDRYARGILQQALAEAGLA